jgi:hypothetical protein
MPVLEILQAAALDYHISAFRKEDFVSNAIGNAAFFIGGDNPGTDVTTIINSYCPVLSKQDATKEIRSPGAICK